MEVEEEVGDVQTPAKSTAGVRTQKTQKRYLSGHSVHKLLTPDAINKRHQKQETQVITTATVYSI